MRTLLVLGLVLCCIIIFTHKSSDNIFTVTYIIDGDTFIINDKYKTRLLSIDTPELPSQSGITSKNALDSLLSTSNYQVILKKDRVFTDHYGRALVYAYLPNGLFINQWLLDNGYASTMCIYPNTNSSICK